MRFMISFQCETVEEAKAVVDAVAAIGKAPHACSKQYLEGSEIGAKVSGKTVDTESLIEDSHPTPSPTRKNISPGEPGIGKIGEKAKAHILDELGTGTIQPHAKYTEHLKLLWKRGEVKYDGSSYYL